MRCFTLFALVVILRCWPVYLLCYLILLYLFFFLFFGNLYDFDSIRGPEPEPGSGGGADRM